MKKPEYSRRLNAVVVLRSCLPLLIFFAAFLSVLLSIGTTGVYEGQEAVYASAARKMADSYDFITPVVNGFRCFAERPGAYWVGAVSIKLFGCSETVLRFPLAFAAGAAALFTFLIGRLFFGTLTGLLASLVLTSSLFFQFAFRYFAAEPFGAAVGLAAVWVFFSFLGAPGKRKGIAFWVLLAINFLFSGTLTFIPIAAVLSAALYTGQKETVGKLFKSKKGLISFFVISFGWYALAVLKNPEILKYLIANECMAGLIFNPAGIFDYPFYFYVLLLLGALFPWSGLMVHSFKHQFQDFKEEPTAVYMLFWILFPLIVFSLFALKNPGFLLYIAAPISIVTAECIRRVFFDFSDETRKNSMKASIGHCIGIAVVSAIAGIAFAIWGYSHLNGARQIGQTAIFGGIFWLFCSLIILAFILKGSRKGVLVIIGSIVPGMLLFIFPYIQGNEPWAEGRKLPSANDFLQRVMNLPSNQKIIFVDDMIDSWYFYVGRDIQACGINPDKEISRGRLIEKKNRFIDKEAVLKNLTSESMLIMKSSSVKDAERLAGTKLHTVTREGNWRLVQIINPVR